MMIMKIKLLSADSHRNGISGEPFITGLFTDEDGRTKMFVDFGEMRFAVLQVDKLAEGDIAFGSNSWRGDYYVNEIRELYPESLKEGLKGWH
jgi:hypothetical protein